MKRHPESRRSGRKSGTTPPGSNPQRRSREPYDPPVLTVYGRLTAITRFGGSTIVDSGAGLGPMIT
jgi:hypothetical protein